MQRIRTYIYYKVNKELFTRIFNSSRFLKGIEVRAYWSKLEKYFVISDKHETKIAPVKSRVLNYAGGFGQRYERLGKSYMLDFINFDPDALVIDIGANMGDFFYSVQIETKNPIRYIGFEPNPSDYLCLEKNAKQARNRIKVYNLALWSSESKLKFYIDSESASSSLIEPKRYSRIIEVTSSRLDSLIEEEIFLLKVEAEGAEPEVLLGAVKLLSKVKYIVVDVGPERGVNEEETREAVVNFLNLYQFSIARENPGHRKTILFRNDNYQSLTTAVSG